MTQPFKYKSDEWYHEMSQKVVDIFYGVQASKIDLMIVFIIILKSTISEYVSEFDLLEDFMRVYDSIKLRKKDEVKKE
jgi:hypothetical protein